MTHVAAAAPVEPPANPVAPAGVASHSRNGGGAPADADAAAEDVSGGADSTEEEPFWDSLPVGREIAMAIGGACVALLLLLCGCCLWAMRRPAGHKNTTRSESHIIRKGLSKKLAGALNRGRRAGTAASGRPPEPELCCISSEVFGAAGVHGAILQTPVKPKGRMHEVHVDESPYVELPENLGETTVVTINTGGGTPAAQVEAQVERQPRPWSALRASGGGSEAARASGEGGVVQVLDSLGESEELNWSPPVAIPWLTDSNNTSHDAGSPAAVRREVAEAMRAVRFCPCEVSV